MEIKEILDKLSKEENFIQHSYCRLFNYEVNTLLDYITNLQQELEEYKDTETYSKRFLYKANKDRLNANLELIQENERLKELKERYQLEKEDYKSRIEKAVEMINKYELIVGYYDYADEDGYWDTDSNNNLQEELKDTLNGRSDE